MHLDCADVLDHGIANRPKSRLRQHGQGVLVKATLLHRQNDADWTANELMPIRSFEVLPWAPSGQPCSVKLELKDGRTFEIDYGNPEGNLR